MYPAAPSSAAGPALTIRPAGPIAPRGPALAAALVEEGGRCPAGGRRESLCLREHGWVFGGIGAKNGLQDVEEVWVGGEGVGGWGEGGAGPDGEGFGGRGGGKVGEDVGYAFGEDVLAGVRVLVERWEKGLAMCGLFERVEVYRLAGQERQVTAARLIDIGNIAMETVVGKS
jgi:hypothetical protein